MANAANFQSPRSLPTNARVPCRQDGQRRCRRHSEPQLVDALADPHRRHRRDTRPTAGLRQQIFGAGQWSPRPAGLWRGKQNGSQGSSPPHRLRSSLGHWKPGSPTSRSAGRRNCYCPRRRSRRPPPPQRRGRRVAAPPFSTSRPSMPVPTEPSRTTRQ